MLRFKCPRCYKTLKSPPEYIGRKAKCTRCGERLVIPTSPASQGACPTPEPAPDPAPKDEPFSVICPNCSGEVGCVAGLAEQRVDCPLCRQPFIVPGASTVAPIPSPSSDEAAATDPFVFDAGGQEADEAAATDPFAFDAGGQEAAEPANKRVQNHQQTNVWTKIGGGIVVTLAVLGFLALKGGSSRSFRPSVAEFRETLIKLSERDPFFWTLGYWKIERQKMLKAVGKPDHTVKIGASETWYWDCSDGHVQLEIFDERDDEVRFKFGVVIQNSK